MAYITFLEYTNLGGSIATESVFDKYEKQAERRLDYFTQDRFKTATTIIDEAKELLTLFIDMFAAEIRTGNVKSYGNGIESFSYSDNQSENLKKEMYQLAIEYLPIEYISAYVDNETE